jgi:hypothetical protein
LIVLTVVTSDEFHLLFCANTHVLDWVEVIDEELLWLTLAWIVILGLLGLSLSCLVGITAKSGVITSCYLFALRYETTCAGIE